MKRKQSVFDKWWNKKMNSEKSGKENKKMTKRKTTTDAVAILKQAYSKAGQELRSQAIQFFISQSQKWVRKGLSATEMASLLDELGMQIAIQAEVEYQVSDIDNRLRFMEENFSSAASLLKSAKSLDECIGQYPKPKKVCKCHALSAEECRCGAWEGSIDCFPKAKTRKRRKNKGKVRDKKFDGVSWSEKT